jgi:tRNA pseudouridine synthase 9
MDDQAKQRMMETSRANCAASEVTFEQGEGSEITTVRINCPLRCLSARDGVWQCHEDGKPSETLVTLLHCPDSETSVVQCKPVTGRTHQIRLHLQLVGFPIANDPCYGGKLHFGENAERLEEIEAAKRANSGAGDSVALIDSKQQNESARVTLASNKSVDLSTPRQPSESEDEFMRRTCAWCRVGEAEAFNETQLHCARIWLHALEYKVRA